MMRMGVTALEQKRASSRVLDGFFRTEDSSEPQL